MGSITDAVRYPFSRISGTARGEIAGTSGGTEKDTNHTFVNNVRFLSMVAIIAQHTLTIYPILQHSASTPFAMLCVVQFFKFGTIAFFLVAGFLFGERIDQYSSLQYYGRRLKNVLLPWLAWYLSYCVLRVGIDLARHQVPPQAPDITRYVWNECVDGGLFGTAYWFVPNLLIALAALLIFRPILRDARIGLVLCVASLFYGANVYGNWIQPLHSRAVFGFVFYLWLGAWGSWHFARLQKWLSRVHPGAIGGLALVALGLSCGESKLLMALHSPETTNTLRITNQLYSILAVLAIMKISRSVWPRVVDVRKHTFGLYLSHPIALASLKVVVPLFTLSTFWRIPAVAGGLLPVMFIITYSGCLLTVQTLLSCSWLRWTVGLATQAGKPGPRQAAHPGVEISLLPHRAR